MTPQATISITADGLALIQGAADAVTVPCACIARSKLLAEVLESADASGEVTIPITIAAFSAWLQYVRADPERSGGMACDASEPGMDYRQAWHAAADGVDEPMTDTPAPVQRLQHLCELLQVKILLSPFPF